jgi:monofunctional biosynthetic peptidoglycan transglycosylase
LYFYLNVAETGIGTYGAEAAAQRYYDKSAAQLTAVEAARIAAALPSPKKRSVTNARGFTRRHGNAIAAGVGTVRGDFDDCIYQ